MNRQKPLQHSWLTREQLQPVILIIVTSLVAGLCLSLIVPFLAPLTWALVLAIIAYPLHTRVLRRINRRSLAAAVSVTLVTGALLAPLAFVSVQIGREALSSVETVKQGLDGGRWRTVIERNPRLAPLLG